MKKYFVLCIAIIFSTAIHAQIPNGGFEDWMSMGSWTMPLEWDELNPITQSTGIYTCMKGFPGSPGSYYLKLISRTITGMGVVPGVAVCGQISTTTYQPISGFPCTSRRGSLVGNWQYMASGADRGYIAVVLSKWDTAISKRDTVSYTDYLLPAMVMNWANFSIPLTYLSGEVPDTAIIVLSASGTAPVDGSYLYIDSLGFSGATPAGVLHVSGVSAFSVFPNPAKDGSAALLYTSENPATINIKITDLSGKTWASFSRKSVRGENKIVISTSAFSKGIYVVNISDGQATQLKSLIVD